MSRQILLVVGLGVVLAGCGSSNAPAVPTPVASPTPQASAPAPKPAGFVCPLPALPDLRNECPHLKGGQLQSFVDIAVDKTIAEHPEYFDLRNTRSGSVKVVDRSKYIGTVVDNIHAQGVCAHEEIEEVQVKNTNEYHEQYNVWSSDGYTRRSYITTCFPAQF